MATSARKAREQQQREELILGVARELLLERGYLGLTMDRIAAGTEYSKGTIYQHFPNKEEVVSALALQTAEKRTAFFERAATFGGRARERMMAIGEADDLFMRLYPHHFRSEKIIDVHSLRAKTSEKRQSALQACDLRCTAVLVGIVRDAIAQGDLELGPEDTPESVTFGLWSMAFGSHLIETMGVDLREKGFGHPREMLFRNYSVFLDGLDWKPLTREWDWEATSRRIQQEVFPDEERSAARAQ